MGGCIKHKLLMVINRPSTRSRQFNEKNSVSAY